MLVWLFAINRTKIPRFYFVASLCEFRRVANCGFRDKGYFDRPKVIRMGAFIGIGALINKSTFEGGALIRKPGGRYGRKALNRIITVFAVWYS